MIHQSPSGCTSKGTRDIKKKKVRHIEMGLKGGCQGLEAPQGAGCLLRPELSPVGLCPSQLQGVLITVHRE